MARSKPKTLQQWMDANELGDEALAPQIEVSRVQISRIRRGKNGASVKTAHKLEKITGIPWHTFLSSPTEVAGT